MMMEASPVTAIAPAGGVETGRLTELRSCLNTHCWHGAAAAASLAATLLPRCCLAAVTLMPRCNCCGCRCRCPCRCCCCSCCRCFCGLLQTPAHPLIPRPLQPGHKLASQSSFLSAERCQSSLGLRDHLISWRASPGDTEHRRSWLNAAAYRWHAQATSWLLPRTAGNGMSLGSISRDPHVAVGRLIPFPGFRQEAVVPTQPKTHAPKGGHGSYTLPWGGPVG